MRALRVFCKYARTQPYDFERIELEKIEDSAADFIADNHDRLAPKYLNLIFNAVKRWYQIHGLIKSTKMFREIRFDTSSRKTDALTEAMLETKHIKMGFKVANLEDQIDWGLYVLCGLRPKIIPQLKVKNLHQRNYEIIDGALRFTTKPPLMIIPRAYAGNKGNITFLAFIPTRLAELLEMQLKINERVTLETKISKSDNNREVYYKIKCLFKHPSIRFNGRPYLLRKYADRILDRITKIYNDEDMKEFLMGHKGKISAIYQITGLTKEKEKELRDMYVKACDEWIDENIFEMRSKEEIDKAELIIRVTKSSGVELDEQKIEALREMFNCGKLTFERFEAEIGKLTLQAFDRQVEARFDQLMSRWQARNGVDTNKAR